MYIVDETVNIAVHEVNDDDSVKEICFASLDGLGETNVDQEFKSFLEKIFGQEAFERFMNRHREDVLQDFHAKKRILSPELTTKLTFKFPLTLVDFFDEQNKWQDVQDNIRKLFGSQVALVGDKIRVDPELARSFFTSSTTAIASHMEKIFQNKNVKSPNTIIMVGDYSEVPMLTEEIKRHFPQKRFIIPEAGRMSVLTGALISAHNQSPIKERKRKYTYGVAGKNDQKLGCKIEKVPRGIQGAKLSRDMASSRNLVSTIGAQANPKKGGGGGRFPEG